MDLDLDAYLKAKATGRMKCRTMMHYEIMKLELEQGIGNVHDLRDYQRLITLRANKDANTSNAFWCIMSIRPKEEETLANLISFIERVVKKEWIQFSLKSWSNSIRFL